MSYQKLVEWWCDRHAWTEPESTGAGWRAFPPNGVMSLPLPSYLEIEQEVEEARRSGEDVSALVEAMAIDVRLQQEIDRHYREYGVRYDRIVTEGKPHEEIDHNEVDHAIRDRISKCDELALITAANWYLRRCNAPVGLARQRVREFCDRHQCTITALVGWMYDNQVRVCHGELKARSRIVGQTIG